METTAVLEVMRESDGRVKSLVATTVEAPANYAPNRALDDVAFGEGVVVHSFTNLYGCRIGSGSRIGTFVEVQRGVEIGAACKVQSHTFICEGVRIEDEVFIGHGVIFVNDKFPRATNGVGALQTESDWELLEHDRRARCVDRLGGDNSRRGPHRSQGDGRGRVGGHQGCGPRRDRGREPGQTTTVIASNLARSTRSDLAPSPPSPWICTWAWKVHRKKPAALLVE